MKRRDEYSQHFLRSPALALELVGHSTIRKKDLVYDIGAGSGVFTMALAKRAARVVAIELDPDTAAILRKNMATYANVQIECTDIMTMALPSEPYKICANIPFHLSSAIIRRVTQSRNLPLAVYVIVQKQFARKLLAKGTAFTSQLGAETAPLYSTRIRRTLHKHDFYPMPNVDTVFLELKRREQPLVPAARIAEYRTFITRCFTDQRYFAQLQARHISIPPGRRPSQLTAEQWARVFTAGV